MLMIICNISDQNEENKEDDSRASDKIGLIRVVMEVLVVMVIRWCFFYGDVKDQLYQWFDDIPFICSIMITKIHLEIAKLWIHCEYPKSESLRALMAQ